MQIRTLAAATVLAWAACAWTQPQAEPDGEAAVPASAASPSAVRRRRQLCRHGHGGAGSLARCARA